MIARIHVGAYGVQACENPEAVPAMIRGMAGMA